MNYATRKNRYLVFALVARNAAGRFLARRLRGPGSTVWSPLVLRWRRRAQRRDQVVVSSAASQTKVQWFPQFHFHFASYLSDRNRLDPRRPLQSQPTRSRQTRIALEQHWASAPDLPATPAQHHFKRQQTTSPAGHASSRPQKKDVAADAPHASRPTIELPVVRWPRPRPGLMRSVDAPKAGRPQKQNYEPGRPFQRNSETWQHWLQVFHLPPTTIDRDRPRARGTQGVKFQFDPAEELVWRRKLPAKRIDEVETEPERQGSLRRSAGHSFATVDEPANALPQLAKTEIAPVATLDPSVMDRLTDDVIRRVEQRIRIERERRGL